MPDLKNTETKGLDKQPYESETPESLEKTDETLQNKRGVKETLEFEDLALSLLVAIRVSKENDNKVDLQDYIHFAKPVTKMIPGFVGLTEIPKELITDPVTPEEREQMIELAKDYGVLEEKAEEFVDDFSEWLENTKKFVDKHIYSFMK